MLEGYLVRKLGMKKLVLCGMAGVLVASTLLAFTDLFLRPIPSPRKTASELLRVSGICPELEGPFFNMSAILYRFTEPLGVGSEADLSVTVTARYNESSVVVVDIKPPWVASWSTGVKFADGGTKWVWVGDFQANVSKTFNFTIKAFEMGEGIVYGRAVQSKFYHGSDGIPAYFGLYFLVLHDRIITSIVEGKKDETPLAVLDLNRLSIVPLDVLRNGTVGTEFEYGVWLVGVGKVNETHVATVKFIPPPEGVALVEGETTWTGNVTVEEASVHEPGVRVPIKLKATKLGKWLIVAYVVKSENVAYSYPLVLWICVFEDKIQIRWDPNVNPTP